MSDEDLAWRQISSHGVQVIESFAGDPLGLCKGMCPVALLKPKVTQVFQPVTGVPPHFSVSLLRLKLLTAPAPSFQAEQAPSFANRETEAWWRRVISMKSHEMGGITTAKAQNWEREHPAFMP